MKPNGWLCVFVYWCQEVVDGGGCILPVCVCLCVCVLISMWVPPSSAKQVVVCGSLCACDDHCHCAAAIVGRVCNHTAVYCHYTATVKTMSCTSGRFHRWPLASIPARVSDRLRDSEFRNEVHLCEDLFIASLAPSFSALVFLPFAQCPSTTTLLKTHTDMKLDLKPNVLGHKYIIHIISVGSLKKYSFVLISIICLFTWKYRT